MESEIRDIMIKNMWVMIDKLTEENNKLKEEIETLDDIILERRGSEK